MYVLTKDEWYTEVCRQFDTDTLSVRRIRDLLKELAFLGVIEQEEHQDGRERGNYLQHRLIEDQAVVQDVLTTSHNTDFNAQ